MKAMKVLSWNMSWYYYWIESNLCRTCCHKHGSFDLHITFSDFVTVKHFSLETLTCAVYQNLGNERHTEDVGKESFEVKLDIGRKLKG